MIPFWRAFGAALLVVTSFLPRPDADAALTSCASAARDGSSLVFPAAGPGKPSVSGAIYPIVFVHGFNEDSSVWTKPATVTWAEQPNIANPESFAGWADHLPGGVPVLFDYREHGLDWVTNPAIGTSLASVITCLAMRTGQKVALVGHSMGGLAARQALSMPGVAEQVSLVITVGTPNLGSFLSYIANDLTVDAQVVDRMESTARRLGVSGMGGEALSLGYRAVESVLRGCAQKIAANPASGVCGELTGLVRQPHLAISAGWVW